MSKGWDFTQILPVELREAGYYLQIDDHSIWLRAKDRTVAMFSQVATVQAIRDEAYLDYNTQISGITFEKVR